MPIVCNELLGRELIKIYQDTDAFNFSIDSMLLASFASVGAKTSKICDLCSGNSPIPLYLTLRTKAKIIGVEVQSHSYDLAMMSIKENNLESQIEMVNANLIDIHKKIGQHTFDLVTCNPPFFKVGDNHINPNDYKAIARHEILATLEDIVKEASLLLNSKGRFAMVHRPDRLVEILNLFLKYNISPKRLQFVYPKIDKECNHILIEGIKDGNKDGLRVLAPLYVYNENNKWTDQILKIYNYEERK
ncbi:TPA: tRNA1(Val) (adenine(37)-N6)-methyltransferase [Candidatus Avacholeplasma faecigallinarum]|nr:tRNA1(Val) (adenine(37)-N6)-methyltransferase [Candidatus Avacholeplasma faecigallinarum]